MKIGIMGAMLEEVYLLAESLENRSSLDIGNRTYHTGKIGDHDICLVFSRWGKVAASSTATTLLSKFELDLLIFTGVAGAIDLSLNIGDVVIANHLLQHDMDATPIFERFQIPLISQTYFTPTLAFRDKAKLAAGKFLASDLNIKISAELLSKFRVIAPKVYEGIIASGDKFISQLEDQIALRDAIPGLLAVKMEGAAVAQVCEVHNLPYVVIRTISDSADHNAHVDFPAFTANISNHYSDGIVKNLIMTL